MKSYIGTKIIQAEPCKAWKNFVNHKAGSDGYKVVYPDGYESWSPKDVFEAAYHEFSGMPFGAAIEAMKAGKRVSRTGWNGKHQYIELARNISYQNTAGEIVNAKHDAIGNQAVAFVGTSGVQLGWLASQADMLAEDWGVVE
jgi:hypothetical protein